MERLAEGATRHVVRVPTAEVMRAIGERIGQAARPGDLLLLSGPFGAGKTTFVQGLARGLGVAEAVTSPSFVLENQYHGRLRLYHVDLYRLERLDSAFLDELEEHLYGDGVAAVEWPGQLPAYLREGAVEVGFEPLPDGSRELSFRDLSEHLRPVVEDRPA